MARPKRNTRRNYGGCVKRGDVDRLATGKCRACGTHNPVFPDQPRPKTCSGCGKALPQPKLTIAMGLTVERVAEKIGIPVEQWPGNCYAIACAMRRKGVVDDCSLRYGHFHGEVSPDSVFSGKRPFQRHGWLELSDNETIIDPTRWVFEAVEPYIYEGANTGEYDVGGNKWREAVTDPPPRYDSTEPRANLAIWKFSTDAHRFVMDVLFEGAPGVTAHMAMWLASLPLQRLREHAEPIYRGLIDGGHRAYIPIDNCSFVLSDEAAE